ncbi:MAG TPA: type II toxin-antitoxin system RelE/ParE family toxin [Smithellaceae bacterium]|jgi:mRNA interferase RelE/StbE|nr:type II toxin-antitoxin system RelE/ParE family toxin [Syntrophaceae bacterium]HOU55443.1 type II toxin-antitoxin system RelE/ParE family toxin [Smithellaceae bacterium]MBP9649864.1 type II toxin-antitoxin system RelE/ParE family toxin [Syntrophaceae bacterium]HQG99088.1 type II toxin-antitoxin system RelE/ParE family toxin [Smithellaceae bacterium]HQH04198.1 type II toxin-antitoxin system RelE/ParE family toxin [Smithellaceae bacterium]
MPYKLAFKESALKEWGKLDRPIREQLKKKLAKRLERPRVEADRVSGMDDAYKIKLRAVGLRLIDVVEEETMTMTVYAVGKRDKKEAYRKAQKRADE